MCIYMYAYIYICLCVYNLKQPARDRESSIVNKKAKLLLLDSLGLQGNSWKEAHWKSTTRMRQSGIDPSTSLTVQYQPAHNKVGSKGDGERSLSGHPLFCVFC